MTLKNISFEEITKTNEKEVAEFINRILTTEFKDIVHHLDADDLNNLCDAYSGKRNFFLVLRNSGKIIGTVGIKEENRQVALLRRLFIAPECRKKGYARILVEKAEEFCRKQRYQMISFRGNNQMDSALRAIEKLKFIRKDIISFGVFHMYIYVKLL